MAYYKIYWTALWASLVLLTGCAATMFVVPPVDLKTESYPTTYEIAKEDILINKPHKDIDSVQFVVLVTQRNFIDPAEDRFGVFIKDSLLKMGFKEVKTENEFAQSIVQHGLHRDISYTYDRLSLRKIYEKMRPYLLIVAKVSRGGLKIFDPESGEILFEITPSHIVWFYPDKELYYPSINLMNAWYKSSGKRGAAQPVGRTSTTP